MITNSTYESEMIWTKPFILLALSNMFLFISFEMLLPILPVLVSHYGGSNTAIGFVMGIFTVTAILVRPFSGVASLLLGQKKLLLLGILICLISTGTYYLTATVLFTILVRMVHGVGFGISTTMYASMASDLVPSSRRGEGMGIFGLGSTVAYAIGPFIGVWLIQSYNFFISFGVSVISLVLSFLFTKQVQGIKLSSVETTSGPLLNRIVEPKALFPSFLCLLLGFSYGGIIGFITLFGAEAGIQNVGLFFLVNALAIVLIRPLAGRIFDKKGPTWVLVPGAFFCMIGLILLSGPISTPIFMIASVCYGIGEGAVFPSLQAWVINRVAPQRRVAANATFFNAFDLGIGSGAIILGLIAEVSDYATMYLVSSLSLLLFLMVYAVYLIWSDEK